MPLKEILNNTVAHARKLFSNLGDNSVDKFYQLSQQDRNTLTYGSPEEISRLMEILRKADELRNPQDRIITRNSEELFADLRGFYNPRPQ